ncbi:MAG: sugar ABC transporter permease, partial [Actinomycetota bacterium]|nr:sugar ABC transporter permease [Actinomycetota bacterium]
SFTDMRITDIRSPFGVSFVGFDNYVDVFQDPAFRKAARNTALYVLFAVPLTIGLGLLVALGLNQATVRLRNVLRLGYFLPYVTSIVAIAVVWRLILGTDAGLLNGLLGGLGVEGPGWLTDSRYSLWSIILMTTWRGLGLQMIIFLAGLQAIPNELYEAASVDGAGRWHQFRYVTLPMLRPTLLFSAVIASIGLMQFFEEPFVMTQGGPLDSTVSVAYFAYEQFSFGNYGYTAAISYVLFLTIAALTFLQFRLLRPKT